MLGPLPRPRPRSTRRGDRSSGARALRRSGLYAHPMESALTSAMVQACSRCARGRLRTNDDLTKRRALCRFTGDAAGKVCEQLVESESESNESAEPCANYQGCTESKPAPLLAATAVHRFLPLSHAPDACMHFMSQIWVVTGHPLVEVEGRKALRPLVGRRGAGGQMQTPLLFPTHTAAPHFAQALWCDGQEMRRGPAAS